MKKLFGKFLPKGDSREHQPRQGGASAADTESVLGYDIREKELSKIHKAAWNGDLAKVKQLAKKDPNTLDKDYRTPLHLACVAGHAAVVQELLEWNAKTNVGDGNAKTPLMKAIECNRVECCNLLLEHRAEVDVTDSDGNTGLHLAVKYGYTNIALALINNGANLNVKNKEGQAPLHLSVTCGKREDMSRLLLEHKADPNIVDKVMRAPLHYACDIDSINQVKQLLEKGANTSMKDAKGWTADDCAVMKANHACSQLVYDHILQQRKYTQMSSSVPNTPRSGVGSLPPSSQTTPRTTTDTSDFGMPAAPVADGSESGEETISRSASGGDKHGGDNSWAEDTDVSSAMDDHRKKKTLADKKETGPVKISLTKNINLDSDDEHNRESPAPRPGSESIRTIQTRIPTPDSVRSSPATPGVSPSPKLAGNQSKIPVRHQTSGASQTSIEENWSDGEQHQRSARVSFKEEKDIRNISVTDDDTDIEDEEEEEADPPKKRKIDIEQPSQGAASYTPSGMKSVPGIQKETAEKMKEESQTDTAFLKDIGLEDVEVDDVSDVSFEETDNDHMATPRGPPTGNGEEATTPRKGILKSAADSGKPPSVQRQESDDEESDWDSTRHSGTESKHSDAVHTPREPVKDQNSVKVEVIHGDEDRESGDEFDDEMESTLNPENQKQKSENPIIDAKRTSQWDSTEEAYSPRTPRDEGRIRGQDISVSGGGVEFEDETEEIDDHIEEAVTNFSASTKLLQKSPAPSYDTPEPKSDSTPPRSHTTPEPHTVSATSTSSEKKTVITAVVEEPLSPRQQGEVEDEGEEEDSEWDSEDSTNSAEEDEEAPPVYMPEQPQEPLQERPQQFQGTPRAAETPREGETPRGQTTSTVSETESVSEWEIERQKEKEQQRLADLEEEQRRQDEWEEEERRRQEELAREVEEELRREEMQEDDSSTTSQDISEVEYDKIGEVKDEVKQDSDHSQKSLERSQRSQRSPVSEVMTSSQKSQPKSHFADILSSFQKTEVDRMESPVARTDSQRSEGSQSSRSQPAAGMKVMSPRSDFSDSQSSQRSQRTMGEIENESPVPAVEEHIKTVRNVQIHSKPPPTQIETDNVHQIAASHEDKVNKVNNIVAGSFDDDEIHADVIDDLLGGRNVVDDDRFDSDEDVGDIENEVVEDIVEPVFNKKAETLSARQPVFDKKEEEYSERQGFSERQSVFERKEQTVSAKVEPQEELFVAKDVRMTESKDTRRQEFSAAPPPSVHDAVSSNIEEQAPPLPLSSAPKVMSHQTGVNGQAEETVEIPQRRPSSPSFMLPDLGENTGLYSSGLEVPFDDDGLSVTSTENGDISLRSENLPYGKDMLVNMNLNDANAVLKLQEHLREHRRQLEHEKGQKMLLENKQKLVAKEKNEMQKRIDNLQRQKSMLEQSKLDLESKIRTLEYNMNEEEEKRRNAEHILDKEKEHHVKLEKQLAGEMEARQQAELAMRNIKIEMRTQQNQMKELEEEKEELQRLLANEKSARQLQEKINEEQQRFQQHLHEESQKTSSEKDLDGDDAQRSLQLADDDIKHSQEQIEKFRNEAMALRAELDRQRIRLTEENNILSSENEKLQLKVEDLRSEVKLNEEALTQYTVQQNLQLSNAKSESAMLGNTLEKERVTREKIQSELDSVKSRLQTTTSQLEKSQQARNELERRLHDDREEWGRQLDRKDQELLKHKETVETLLQKLNSTESKLNAVENELHISNSTLLERSNQNSQIQRDLQYYKTAQENYDSNYRKEKEQNAKLLGKIESLQDRLTAAQHDNLSLKQQLETAQAVATDRSGVELNDRLNNLMTTLKADHEKAKLTLEEKNLTLQDSISRLKEEVRNGENRRNSLEQDLRKLNQEYNEMVRKHSVAEATLEVALKARDSLEQERSMMKIEMEKLQQRYNSAQEKTIESQRKIAELVEKLERTEQSRQLSNQQLADTSATVQAFNTSKSDLEEQYQKLTVDNVRVEAELKHEKQKVEMLQRDLQDSQKVRSSLEALCSNLKSTNSHLEEKLGGEVVSHNMLLKEAEEAKDLWEKEVVSRSKLGIRIAQLDRQKQEFASQLEEEKRRTRKALEQKQLAECKLEAEQDKSGQLQKEIASLKAYLKVAKKKLKDGGSDDGFDKNASRYNNLSTTFDQEREAMEEMLISVKSQLEHMKLRLQDEIEEKEKVHEKNLHLESELKALKKLEKSVQKIDRSKKKLEQEFQSYKSTVETDYTDKAGLEELKKEIEARYRLELNRKLDEVNNYLEEQARTRQRLDTSREEQENKLRSEKRKLEEDNSELRIKYEQSQAQKETKELEAKRYRDLYESEMQWRMRLSEQVYRSTDKAFGFKNNAERQRNRMYGSLTNLSLNGHSIDLNRLAEDPLSSKLKAELDRSIAKHLEAAPHDNIKPVVQSEDPILSSNFAKSNAEYMELLKRKYCV